MLVGASTLVLAGKHQVRYLYMLPSYVESGTIVLNGPELVSLAYQDNKLAMYSVEFEKISLNDVKFRFKKVSIIAF